jgi:hypothetical protein
MTTTSLHRGATGIDQQKWTSKDIVTTTKYAFQTQVLADPSTVNRSTFLGAVL